MTSPDSIEENVLFNTDVPATRLCFVCGLLLTDEEQKIVDSKTSCTHSPLASKLGNLVGDQFYIIVSKFDEICSDCFLIINQVDEFEFNLNLARSRLLGLLKNNYNLPFVEGDVWENGMVLNQFDCIDEVQSEDDQLNDSSPIETVIDHTNESKVYSPPEINSCDDGTDMVDETSDFNLDSKCLETSTISSSKVKVEISLDDQNVYSLDGSREMLTKDILCEYCCSSFYNEAELNEHCAECHAANQNISSNFDAGHKVFIDSSIQEENEDNTVSNIIFKCGVCEFSHEDKHVVMKHLQTMHKVACEICGAHFEKMSALLVHYMSHGKSEGVCVCKICEMPFPNKPVLARHLLVHRKSEGPITCQVCGKVCHDNLHAMYHRRNEHSIIQDLSCGLCNAPMESNVELKHHILMLHRGKKEYKCKECNKTFSRQLQYENHRTYAHGNSQCRICGKHIENLVKLRQHELRHARSETKKFECDVCHKIFKTQGGLKVHAVSHTGKYKFFCEFCGRGFMSSVILEEHKGVHTKEERYVCDICGRKFVLYSTFHLHKQWHKDPYPFPCKICGRKFRYRSERSNHVRRDHTGETPYKCDHCDAAFIKLGYLKKHSIVHTKVRPYTCQICEKGYDQKKALARHYANVHNDPSLLQSFPKICQYKVALRPDEYPEVDDD